MAGYRPYCSRILLIVCVLSLASDAVADRHATDITSHWIRYVDAHAPPGGNGWAWETAFNDLQAALTAAVVSEGLVDRIAVAQGTYRPSARTVADDPRSATFHLLSGVSIKGGFAGITSSTPDDWNVDRYRTVLTGDLAGDDGPEFSHNEENAYHVVMGSGTDATAVLEGFTVTGGNASPVSWANTPALSGGGLYNDHGGPTIVACIFQGNAMRSYGGAIFNQGGSPAMRRCKILSNGSWDDYNVCGGVVNRQASRTTLIDCYVSGNVGGDVSAIWNDQGSSLALTNCVVNGNFGYDAAIISGGNSALSLTNCVVASNYNILIVSWVSPYTAGIKAYGGVTSIANCIIWGNYNPAGRSEHANRITSRIGRRAVQLQLRRRLDRYARGRR
jgi:hypothetical protein